MFQEIVSHLDAGALCCAGVVALIVIGLLFYLIPGLLIVSGDDDERAGRE